MRTLRNTAANLLCGMALATAQAPLTQSRQVPFTVIGTIPGSDSAEVYLLNDGGSAVAEAMIGAGGRFRISVGDPGHYRLAVFFRGRFRVVQDVVLTSGDPVVTLHLVGPPVADMIDPNRSSAPLVSARRLAGRIPGRARRLYQQAEERSNRGDFAGAAERLEKAIALAPTYIEAINDLAVVHMRRQDDDRALQTLERALSLEPTAWQPHLNRGVILMRREVYGPARAELEQARAMGPASPLPLFHLGRLDVLEGRASEAQACFTSALQMAPDFVTARLFLGYARILGGRLEAAHSDLALYLKQAPHAANATDVQRLMEEIDRKLKAPQRP